MKKKQPTKKRGNNIVTFTRRQQITNEIYGILHTEAHKWFEIINKRDDNVNKRLMSMESAGVPAHTLEDINRQLSSLLYNQRKLIKANEELLSFFNITKEFLTSKEETTPTILEALEIAERIAANYICDKFKATEEKKAIEAMKNDKGYRRSN